MACFAKKGVCDDHNSVVLSIVVVQSLSCVWLFATPWTAACQNSLSFPSMSWLKLMSIELVMPSNHLILCHPLLVLPSIILSIRVFSNELALYIRWPKCWSFSYSSSPSNEYSGLISLGLTGLISLLSKGFSRVFSSLKASVLWCSAFFMVQLSHPCVIVGKTIAWTIWTFFSKVMSKYSDCFIFRRLFRSVETQQPCHLIRLENHSALPKLQKWKLPIFFCFLASLQT